MRQRPTAAERLTAVLTDSNRGVNRTRFQPVEITLSPRHVFPTGIYNISVGLEKDGKWWNAVLSYTVGDTLVCRRRTTNHTLTSIHLILQRIFDSEIIIRPGGAPVQRLYKKHFLVIYCPQK